jgi:hypothetical protein
MMKKHIYIFDPLSCSASNGDKKKFHEAVADKLHVAFFTCIYKFFEEWHVDCINWSKKHLTVTSTNFHR